MFVLPIKCVFTIGQIGLKQAHLIKLSEMPISCDTPRTAHISHLPVYQYNQCNKQLFISKHYYASMCL